jgi:hypothetical protein
MTTRFLTTDQNGNGDQTYWDINGYFLHGPSGEKLNLGGGNTTVTASNEIVQIGTSYLRIPQGISNERPNPSYAGMIRYLTTGNLLEYFNGQTNQWLPISQPPPTLNTVSPVFFNIGTDNSFNLTGSNFGLTGASIVVIGTNGSGTIINSTISSVLTESSALVQFDASATQNLTDISNEFPFAMRITNNNSGLSSLLQNAITNANVGPIIIQPNPQTVPFQTFPVQDPSASFTLIGEDESSPPHYPFSSITITSGAAGGITDVSLIEPSGALISVPSGNRTLATAGNYPFNVKLVDGSGAFNNTTLTLALADPIVNSIVPSSFAPGTVDLSVNGNYFVNDSGVSYVKQSDGSVVTPTTTYKSINLLETNVTFSNLTTSDIIYDISVNNGSVFKLYPSVLTVRTNFITFSYLQTSGITLTPTISYEDSSKIPSGGPVTGGYTVVHFVPTSTDYTQNYQWDISFSQTTTISEILVIGGGGCGSNDTNNTQGNGGGGAGGFRETNSLVYTFTQGTNYVVQCGRPGQQRSNGAQTYAYGQTTINTDPSGPGETGTARSAYASGISTGSTNIYVASGGGNGGYYAGNPGGNGGSGAGAGLGGSGGIGNIGSYTPSEGNNGDSAGGGGGGGGGAGAPGSGQNGGNGKASIYFGGTYAGGGGGSGSSNGSGGSGGGGAARGTGSTSYQAGYWGLPGTGGGGGASSFYPSSPGGSGRVEFRFLSFA